MKKVLLVAYYFPPLGWSGVQRTLKFVKYLRNFGWEPIVVTVNKTTFSILDETLNIEIPKGVKIIRIDDLKLKDYTDNIKEKMLLNVEASFNLVSDKCLLSRYENEIEKTLEKLRNLILFPDGNAIWADSVIKKISEKLILKDIDLVYTTSGPYSSHIIGNYLKSQYKIPWVADFRDEWTNNPYLGIDSNLRYEMEKNIENNILINCDKILTATSGLKQNYINNFKINKNKIEVITNGYDEDDFTNIIERKKSNKFIITHNGSFYSSINPYSFIIALNNLLSKRKIDISNLEVQFIGNIENKIKTEIKAIDKFDIVNFKGYLPHKKSLQLCSESSVLLLIVGEGEKVKSVYTGKVFEYLRFKKAILALSPKKSLIEELLAKTGCGSNVEYSDIKGIENLILRYYEMWKNDKTLIVNENEIKNYERQKLTEKLSKCFNDVIVNK